jgi:cob(I)alamin adenosyltransferase
MSCIHIYTGDGKGKSTAAAGLAIRFAGSGGKVQFSQFLKGNNTAEFEIMKKVENIDLYLPDRTFGFTFRMNDEEKKEAGAYYRDYLERAFKRAAENKVGLLVLDESIGTDNVGFFDRPRFLELLKNRPENMEVVLTGREPAEDLIEIADYVSEIKMVKHPYTKGLNARRGIEY